MARSWVATMEKGWILKASISPEVPSHSLAYWL